MCESRAPVLGALRQLNLLHQKQWSCSNSLTPHKQQSDPLLLFTSRLQRGLFQAVTAAGSLWRIASWNDWTSKAQMTDPFPSVRAEWLLPLSKCSTVYVSFGCIRTRAGRVRCSCGVNKDSQVCVTALISSIFISSSHPLGICPFPNVGVSLPHAERLFRAENNGDDRLLPLCFCTDHGGQWTPHSACTNE